MYSEKVMAHFKNPHNAGQLENPDGIGRVGNPYCGDVMEFFIKVENGKIINAKFKTFGCCAAIACSDVVCEMAKGKTLEQALKITKSDVVKQLGQLPPIKLHCSVLGIDALHKAIEDYRQRK